MGKGKGNSMFNARTGILAGTGVMVAALLALGTTAASAATASGAGHVTAPQAAKAAAADASGCVTETFTTADEPYYEACVADAQILFNDLWYTQNSQAVYLGVNALLTVDGSYGPDTAGVVGGFQSAWGLTDDQKLGPQTWKQLCTVDYAWGYRGTYWHDAGCSTEPGL
jgi:peptidoglycan hydrolase-like protein with peptidoglycan-binding domain